MADFGPVPSGIGLWALSLMRVSVLRAGFLIICAMSTGKQAETDNTIVQAATNKLALAFFPASCLPEDSFLQPFLPDLSIDLCAQAWIHIWHKVKPDSNIRFANIFLISDISPDFHTHF